MVTLDECGVRYLTAASVQAFRENGALWVMRYLFGKSSMRSPAFARSIALNDGMKQTLHYDNVGKGEDTALECYLRLLEEWSIDPSSADARNEHDSILPMFELAVKALQEHLGGLRKPNSSGLATHTFIGEVNTPFLSVPSFVFDEVQVHIKYTHRCPSKPKPKDMMAMSIDALARNQAPVTLYVTTKRKEWMAPASEELLEARRTLEEDTRALEVFLAAVESPEHALAMCPLNLDFYQWKPQLIVDCRTILLNSTEKIRGIVSAQSTRLRDFPSRDAYSDLLPGDRPGDAEVEF